MTTPTSEPRQNAHGGLPMTGTEQPREVTIEAAEHPRGANGTCSCCHGPAPVGVRASAEDGPSGFVFWCPRCAQRIGAAAPALLHMVDRLAQALYLDGAAASWISGELRIKVKPWADVPAADRQPFLDHARDLLHRMGQIKPPPDDWTLPPGA